MATISQQMLSILVTNKGREVLDGNLEALLEEARTPKRIRVSNTITGLRNQNKEKYVITRTDRGYRLTDKKP